MKQQTKRLLQLFEAEAKLARAKLDLAHTYAEDGAYADAARAATEAAAAFDNASKARLEAMS